MRKESDKLNIATNCGQLFLKLERQDTKHKYYLFDKAVELDRLIQRFNIGFVLLDYGLFMEKTDEVRTMLKTITFECLHTILLTDKISQDTFLNLIVYDAIDIVYKGMNINALELKIEAVSEYVAKSNVKIKD